MTDTPQGNRGYPYRAMMEPPRQEPRWQFLWGWILAPLAVLGMAYVLQHTSPAVTWEQILETLAIRNKEKYTMLFHLCLAAAGVVAAVRILGRKDKN